VHDVRVAVLAVISIGVLVIVVTLWFTGAVGNPFDTRVAFCEYGIDEYANCLPPPTCLYGTNQYGNCLPPPNCQYGTNHGNCLWPADSAECAALASASVTYVGADWGPVPIWRIDLRPAVNETIDVHAFTAEDARASVCAQTTTTTTTVLTTTTVG
jgi:hypothetical protein